MNTYIKRSTFLWSKIAIKGVILVILLLLLNIFQNQVRNSFYTIYESSSKILLTAGQNTSQAFSFLNYKSVQHQNDALRQENQKLLVEVSSLKDSLKQFQDAQQFTQGTQEHHFATLISKVIAADLANDVVLIDKGSLDGIAENMPVISSENILYGRVVKVYKNFSQVMIISNKNSVVDVKIQQSTEGQTPVLGAVKGQGGGLVSLDLVESEATLNINDVLISSGLEGLFPGNMLVGKITSVNKNNLKPFQSAKVQPFFSVKDIDNLFVITDFTFK